MYRPLKIEFPEALRTGICRLWFKCADIIKLVRQSYNSARGVWRTRRGILPSILHINRIHKYLTIPYYYGEHLIVCTD